MPTSTSNRADASMRTDASNRAGVSMRTDASNRAGVSMRAGAANRAGASMRADASPPAGRTRATPSVADEARVAPTTMGFERAEAARAVDAAMSHVGHEATLEQVVRAALRACPQPRAC